MGYAPATSTVRFISATAGRFGVTESNVILVQTPSMGFYRFRAGTEHLFSYSCERQCGDHVLGNLYRPKLTGATIKELRR
jgi:hypothetical protein